MCSIPSQSLVDQARAILGAATVLQERLDKLGLPQPGFESSVRRDWHDAFDDDEVLESRCALLDASQKMLNLVRGPIDTLLHLTFANVTEGEVLRTSDALKVAETVPL